MVLPAPTLPPPPKRRSRALLAVGIGLIFLVLVAFFLVNYVNQLQSTVSPSSTSRNPTSNQECWYLSAEGSALYLTATLGNGLNNYSVTMLIDTGADVSVAPAELANKLGLDLTTGSPVTLQGIFGDTQQLYLHNVDLTLDKLHTISIPIAISTQNTVPYSLGRRGFLSQFSLQVNPSLGNFCLTQP